MFCAYIAYRSSSSDGNFYQTNPKNSRFQSILTIFTCIFHLNSILTAFRIKARSATAFHHHASRGPLHVLPPLKNMQTNFTILPTQEITCRSPNWKTMVTDSELEWIKDPPNEADWKLIYFVRTICGPVMDSIHPPASSIGFTRETRKFMDMNLLVHTCPSWVFNNCHSSDVTRTSSALLLLHVMSSTNKLFFHELIFRTWKPDAY